ncbi:hypothetical protein C8R44DRAFT_900732 [Mycena epipterygia]|nr:hypothetical protein C8R44DRAFT_900732 [Mycena epipterygia]
MSAPYFATVRRRLNIACTNCRKRKIKCVTVDLDAPPGESPCARCEKKGLVCEYVPAGEQEVPAIFLPVGSSNSVDGLDKDSEDAQGRPSPPAWQEPQTVSRSSAAFPHEINRLLADSVSPLSRSSSGIVEDDNAVSPEGSNYAYAQWDSEEPETYFSETTSERLVTEDGDLSSTVVVEGKQSQATTPVYELEPGVDADREDTPGRNDGLSASSPPQQPDTYFVDAARERHIVSRILASYTHYGELQSATSDGDFGQILGNLKLEWFYVGGVLLGLVALETSIFTTDPQSLFEVDAFAQKAIAASSVATSFGILCNTWFVLRYYRLESSVFMTRARDIYGSYLFFSLSARLPLAGTLFSLAALTVFIGRIAYNTFPVFVIWLGVAFCLVMGLQFVARGAEVLYSLIALQLSVLGERSVAPFRNQSRVDLETGSNSSGPAS